jgi:hypothetical protein
MGISQHTTGLVSILWVDNVVRISTELSSPSFRLRIGAVALVMCALAAVAVIVSSRGDDDQMGIVLEERKSEYLGDEHALSTEAARKQAEDMFSTLS